MGGDTSFRHGDLIGTSNMNLEGTYYFPVAPVEIGGDGISLGNMMIAWTFWIHGRVRWQIPLTRIPRLPGGVGI